MGNLYNNSFVSVVVVLTRQDNVGDSNRVMLSSKQLLETNTKFWCLDMLQKIYSIRRKSLDKDLHLEEQGLRTHLNILQLGFSWLNG